METDGSDPYTCSPVQLAAVMVDPVKLEIIKDSEFNINLKPEKLESNVDNPYGDSDILDWHSKVKGSTPDNILADWKTYPAQQKSWEMFVNYLDKYHSRSSRKSMFSAPLASGYNIFRFDLKIIDRLSKKYDNVTNEGTTSLFYPRDTIDVMNLVFYWFEGSKEIKNLTMDALRDYLGISSENSHDALKDVQDTAEILIRFLKLHRKLFDKVKFKDSFAK
jgi:DNA polymerase III epsilon subunit-like protein